jgi:hypothetical protein
MQKGRILRIWFTRKKIEKLLGIMQLSQMLLANGIDPKYWLREQGNKSIADLHAELEAGETKLETIAGMLVRVVRVVAIVVRVRLGDEVYTQQRREPFPPQQVKDGQSILSNAKVDTGWTTHKQVSKMPVYLSSGCNRAEVSSACVAPSKVSKVLGSGRYLVID